ncbi:MAG: type 1 glutamine amidotransferase [Methylobacterium mesophilicum]|nr:type 1 glutamine amidotransferase [Methylobacterium mesophilicum]
MKRVLVIQNQEGAGLGQLGDALAERGIEIDLRRAFGGEAIPATPAHDGLIVLGGGQSALDDEDNTHFPALLGLARDAAYAGLPVLGICLGAQLLARALGAENLLGRASEFGWHAVTLTPEGAEDPVLGHLPREFPIFQWHDDTFILPRGASRLAGNDATHNQAFRFGRAAYGIQFHFEADRKLVREWSETFAGHLAEKQPAWAARMDAEAARHGAEAEAAGRTIAHGWIDLL